MKKILLLTTGGTIASVLGKEGLYPEIPAEEIVSYLPEQYDRYKVESKTLMNVDSTNMQPESWVKIAEAVNENYDMYDGFVITHGTDTMAYTSAALSYMLQNLAKPVVITGSQIPIHYKRTDAKKNISDAVRFACEDVGGVFTVFGGLVIIGTRVVKLRTISYDAFESINFPYIARVNNSEVSYQRKIYLAKDKKIKFNSSICPDVLLLKLHPGTKPELFDYIKKLYKGIVIETFGTGGIPFQERSLVQKIHELINSGITVVFTTQVLEEGEDLGLYEVGRKVPEDMIIRTRDMNTEAIIPKLMWALGQTNEPEKVKKIMATPIAYDITPTK
ncbi:asparaginase [Metabacillus litoralis]|uniref:asparaginase n=1 Tax=Metabacillus litoralis TaxID=152268 RepID=UPI0020421311|nr:asparaginase [Metabacillus litoralis]MCM3654143.1 asparaginase [Metabacillus litoralis]